MPNRQSGFSLIEILVVISFFAIIGGLSLLYGIDSYRKVVFHSDRNLLVAALQRARAQSMGNICLGAGCVDGKPHGVHVTDDAAGMVVSYTVFQGASYGLEPAYNDVISANRGTKHTGVSDVVFAQLSGRANPSGDITLVDSLGNQSVVTVGSEGEIRWTN